MQAVIDLSNSSFYKTKVAGVSILKRHLFCLQKADVKSVFIISPDEEFILKEAGNKRLKSLKIEILKTKSELNKKINQDILVIEDDAIYDPGLLVSYIAEKKSIACKQAKISYYVKNDLSKYFENKALEQGALENIFIRKVESASDVKRIEKDMVSSLRTSSDTFISRTINRPVSLFVTSLIMHTGITPNMITTFNFLLGLAGIASIWLIPGYFKAFAAGLLFHVSSVLDGCDGEIARLKFQGSNFGARYDDFVDDFTNYLFYGSAALYTSLFWITDKITWICTILGIVGYTVGKILQMFIIKKEKITNVKHQTFYFEKRSENFGKNPFMWIYKVGRHVARNDFLALLALVAGIFSVYWLAPYVIFAFGMALMVSMFLELVNQIKSNPSKA